MPNKCGQQYQQQNLVSNTNFKNATPAHHRKSHSLDASNILQASPTNTLLTGTISSSTNASASGAGGMTTNPQCNINAAAIHASATTKSTQNMSER